MWRFPFEWQSDEKCKNRWQKYLKMYIDKKSNNFVELTQMEWVKYKSRGLNYKCNNWLRF